MELSDIDFLQDLIDTPDPPKSPRGPRKKQDIRDHTTWFTLEHIVDGTCSQGENCLGTLVGKGPNRVTSIVNGVEMCRFCFLDGLAYVDND